VQFPGKGNPSGANGGTLYAAYRPNRPLRSEAGLVSMKCEPCRFPTLPAFQQCDLRPDHPRAKGLSFAGSNARSSQ